ncbi:uncharacterized protein LOC125573490 [Nematostella vectensis]|uniref:uncharacterized protein LOC125573490 n=1 Tax=Nematostella vectensis TaxID=45351 RepID=UPI0020771B62|nr:uncharacterized protein LOC125573490 [Nematostella vectensis]
MGKYYLNQKDAPDATGRWEIEAENILVIYEEILELIALIRKTEEQKNRKTEEQRLESFKTRVEEPKDNLDVLLRNASRGITLQLEDAANMENSRDIYMAKYQLKRKPTDNPFSQFAKITDTGVQSWVDLETLRYRETLIGDIKSTAAKAKSREDLRIDAFCNKYGVASDKKKALINLLNALKGGESLILKDMQNREQIAVSP